MGRNGVQYKLVPVKWQSFGWCGNGEMRRFSRARIGILGE